MPGYHSPYSSRPPSSNIIPKIVISVLGLIVIALGVFLLADRLGGAKSNNASTNGSSPNGVVAVASPKAGTPAPTQTPIPTPTGPASTAESIAQRWVLLWGNQDYADMYDLISNASKQSISKKDFVARYQGIASAIGETSIKATVNSADTNASSYQMHVVRETSTVGEIAEDNTIPIVHDTDGYKVDWTPSLIFANLADGFVRWQPNYPGRGQILDRNGKVLATLGSIDEVGVVPGQIKNESQLLSQLSQLIGMSQNDIKSDYKGGKPDWFMPIKNFRDPMDPALEQKLEAIPGVVIQKQPARVYPAGAAAADITGYVSQITADELPKLSKEGYQSGDMIGRAGIESWGEKYLRGKPGGRLVIVGPDNAERRVIKEVKAQQADDVVTTIDINLQKAAYNALGDRPGAIVVLDPTNGAVLAMVSNPSYDPNEFILGITPDQLKALNDPNAKPLFNRATQGLYPIGSTFKVITTSAAMLYLGMGANSPITCPASWTIPGTTQPVFKDWSYPNGQGTLTLSNALTQSCDTAMYQIGYGVDQKDPNLLPNTAKAFGLGSPTGIPELPEASGIIPDPAWVQKNVPGGGWSYGDAVNLSIGQGYMVATPLQVADMYAAIANGGTLWQPYLVSEVRALGGNAVYTHKPKARGKLPISAAQAQVLHNALQAVVNAPNGTAAGLSATHPFDGDPHQAQIAGKTGTAESGQPMPQAWFASFTPVDGAKMAASVLVEHGGEGGDISAPIDRQVTDAFYQYVMPSGGGG